MQVNQNLGKRKQSIVLFVNIIDLTVFLMRLCCFYYRMFWVLQPTLSQTMMGTLSLNKCWRCFLSSLFNWDKKYSKYLISAWIQCTNWKNNNIVRCQIQLQNKLFWVLFNPFCFIILVSRGWYKVNIKLIFMLTKHWIIGVNMLLGKIQKSVAIFMALFLNIYLWLHANTGIH